jgi:FdrA protein
MSVLETARSKLSSGQKMIRALYCGGTFAYEALWLMRRLLKEVDSNLDGTLGTSSEARHTVIDLGAEQFTTGRPHPMIDSTIRRGQLLEVALEPEIGVVVCDVVLGWGAHTDPAGALAEDWDEMQQIARGEGREIIGIATVCGTPDDPQGYEQQCRVLQEHDFILAESNAQAVRLAALAAGAELEAVETGSSINADGVPTSVASFDRGTLPEAPALLTALFAQGPRVINLGLRLFADQLDACGVPAVHVDWRPPAGGDERLASLLERLR